MVLTIGFNSMSIKCDKLLVGDCIDETIGLTAIGVL